MIGPRRVRRDPAVGGWAGPKLMQQVYQRATVEEAESALLAGDPGRGVREASGDDR